MVLSFILGDSSLVFFGSVGFIENQGSLIRPHAPTSLYFGFSRQKRECRCRRRKGFFGLLISLSRTTSERLCNCSFAAKEGSGKEEAEPRPIFRLTFEVQHVFFTWPQQSRSSTSRNRRLRRQSFRVGLNLTSKLLVSGSRLVGLGRGEFTLIFCRSISRTASSFHLSVLGSDSLSQGDKFSTGFLREGTS